MQTLVPVTREEKILNAIATGENLDFTPVTREEKFLFAIIGAGDKVNPATREEYFMSMIIGEDDGLPK